MRPPPAPTADSFEERWKPRRRAIALFGAVMTLVMWLGSAFRPCYIGAGSVDTSGVFVGTTRYDIRIFEPKSRTEVRLTDHTGSTLSPPCWTYWNGELWYWSPEYLALIGIDATGKRRSITPREGVLSPKKPVVSLHRTAKGFLLNLSMPQAYRQQRLVDAAGVLYVPRDDPKRARLLPGLRDARGNSAFEEFAGRDAKGRLVLWANAEGPTRTLKQNGADWIYWDFTSETGKFAFVRAREAGLSDGEHVLWTRGSGGTSSFYGIGFAPGGDIWVSEDGLTHAGGVALLDEDTGKFRGWRVKSVFPISSPVYEADTKLIPLLRQLQDGK